jgi:hypothetical protein
MRRKVKLIYEIISEISRASKTLTTDLELTSDHDNCGLDISERCSWPREDALQANEDYLFFDYIYSTSYDTTPKRYITSLAITRDSFHSTAEDT